MRIAEWTRYLRDRPRLLIGVGAILLLGQAWYATRVVEFYPALMLPGGASLVRDGEQFTTTTWILFAVRRDGTRVDVDEHALLSTLPAQYRAPLMERGFGLLAPTDRSDVDAAEARRWLQARLRDQLENEEVTALEIVRVRSTPSTAPGPHPYLPLEVKRVDLE